MTDTPRTDIEKAGDLPEITGASLDHESEVLEPGTNTPPAPDGEATAESLGLALPDDAEEAKAVLLMELSEARQESGELLANLQRVAAEFDNFRKRVERDQLDNVRRASQRVIEALLPALDSFDAAMAHEPSTSGEEKILEGLRGTHAQLLEALEREGFSPIEALGKPFDPAEHEAVSVIPGEGEQIVEQELRKGYVMRGRVVRPTLVIVGHA